ncbi:PASTA domain-containing protein [Rhodococcus sp. HM1]|uniref:PASTA domain-containing protein n=1 Tax=Rhodococcus sp. HM1 TaxID=2937759 RepID=UPI00200A1130|nr:PASTA domain-containing protein [Rhodococcus sp. HM1]MCK8671647.1 PASTA domain-containing protein [Rhodococcus sp. HM1]
MKPYLRVLAGMFAGITLWLAFVELIHGKFSASFTQLVFTAILAYLAVGKPIRDYRARKQAEYAGLAARAEAGHLAYLAGDPAAFAPPPPAPQSPKVRRGVVIAALVAAAFVIFGIISDISDGLESPSDDDAMTTPTAPPNTSGAAPVTAAAAATAHTPSPSATAIMPDVVCMNLQEAQDTIQTAGVFYSKSVDATGAGRAQLLDRNWVVVEQTPKAGVVIGEGDAVLSVVKEDEPHSC